MRNRSCSKNKILKFNFIILGQVNGGVNSNSVFDSIHGVFIPLSKHVVSRIQGLEKQFSIEFSKCRALRPSNQPYITYPSDK